MVAPTFWLRKHLDLALRGFLFAIFSTSCLSVRRFALLATSDKSERETVRCCTQVTTRGCASSCVPTSTFPPLTFFLFFESYSSQIPQPTSERETKQQTQGEIRSVQKALFSKMRNILKAWLLRNNFGQNLQLHPSIMEETSQIDLFFLSIVARTVAFGEVTVRECLLMYGL